MQRSKKEARGIRALCARKVRASGRELRAAQARAARERRLCRLRAAAHDVLLLRARRKYVAAYAMDSMRRASTQARQRFAREIFFFTPCRAHAVRH